MRKTVSRIYGNGATIVPKKVREALNIEAGDILVWKIDKDKKVAIVSVEKDVLAEISREIRVKGRWTGKLYKVYVSKRRLKK